MKRNELDFFEVDGPAGAVLFASVMISVFAIPLATEFSLFILLYLLIPLVCGVGMLNHTDALLGYRETRLWRLYRKLPPDLKAQVPLTREWIKGNYHLLERDEQDRIYSAVDALDDAAIARKREEERQLVAYNHIIAAAKDAEQSTNEEVENLKQINDEGRKMLDSPL